MAKRKIGSTECVHAGAGPCEDSSSITTPIVHSAPFTFESTKDLVELVEGRSVRRQPEYGRMGDPTVMCVERRLAALAGAENALLFASGMATATTLFLSVLKSGDHIVMTSDSYQRTRDFAAGFMKKFGVTATVVPPTLESHPHHAIAKELMSGFGGVVTFLLNGDFEKTARLIDNIKIPKLGPSLGGV